MYVVCETDAVDVCKFIPVQTMKAGKDRRIIAQLMFILDTKWRCVKNAGTH